VNVRLHAGESRSSRNDQTDRLLDAAKHSIVGLTDVCRGRFRLDSSGLVPPHMIPVPLQSQLELSIAA
jgi:hypothetical protein